MHAKQFRQIMQDAEVANAIGPIARKHRLSMEETSALLQKCGVARAENVAQIALGELPPTALSKL